MAHYYQQQRKLWLGPVCAGEIAANSRQEAVRRFSRDDSLRVAVLSIKAAGSNFPHRNKTRRPSESCCVVADEIVVSSLSRQAQDSRYHGMKPQQRKLWVLLVRACGAKPKQNKTKRNEQVSVST